MNEEREAIAANLKEAKDDIRPLVQASQLQDLLTATLPVVVARAGTRLSTDSRGL